MLPPPAPVPEYFVEEVLPPAEEEPAVTAPPTTQPAKVAPSATPSASATASPTASPSTSASEEAIATERTDFRQGPNIPLLAVLSVVIVGCIAGLVKVIGLPRSRASH
ncbi:hypothetical protein [Arthrobacter cheniae]|uniref:hypothetical protein n=1 Tax=Arthrobacter cheniae TaxID=1258888 RepID=UPI0011C40FBA|nr:hypothetical protein [Arthrobacter cheniae]